MNYFERINEQDKEVRALGKEAREWANNRLKKMAQVLDELDVHDDQSFWIRQGEVYDIYPGCFGPEVSLSGKIMSIRKEWFLSDDAIRKEQEAVAKLAKEKRRKQYEELRKEFEGE